jgi:hypothetical protein
VLDTVDASGAVVVAPEAAIVEAQCSARRRRASRRAPPARRAWPASSPSGPRADDERVAVVFSGIER